MEPTPLFTPNNSPPFYTVVAPKVVRPNSDYHVAVSTSAISEPSTVYLELNACLKSGGLFKVSQTATVEANTTRVIKLEIGDATPGNYKLISRGLSGIVFSDITELEYDHKSYSVFIQTDRSVYKPASKVLFRTVLLDSRLRPPQKDVELEIYITDGQGNRIKQWKPKVDSKGVFSGELQLSDCPVLGDWKIFVKIFDQTVEKVFQVAEYVLPKFEVSVDVPKNATFNDSSLTATIQAKYLYGKPVKGEATVTVSSNSIFHCVSPTSQLPVRKVVPIDGKAIVNFDIASELGLTENFERTIELEATVEEELTGRTQNATAQMTLHQHKYKIEFIKTAETYKPGLKYTMFIKITNHDGSPVQDQTNRVEIQYSFDFAEAFQTNISKMLDEHGMIQLDFYPPSDKKFPGPLKVEAKYLNLRQQFDGPKRAFSPSETFILAILKTESPTVNKDLEIEVNSTAPLKYLNYEVLGRGDILVADSIQVPETNTASFKFLATPAMAPTAHVIVYYIRDDGEMVADALDLQLSGALQNFVTIETSAQEMQPGASVDIIFASKPNSCIGVLGIDQSSLLLKSGNDISHEQVLNEIKSYDAGSKDSPISFDWGSPYRSSSQFSARKIFTKAGAIILTNGYIEEKKRLAFRTECSNAVFFGGAAAQVSASPFAAPKMGRSAPMRRPPIATPVEKPKVRKHFPETWIWEMLEAQPDGKAVLQRSVPDTITSWVLSAFSVDPVHGFGLIEEPRKLKVFQSFFMSLNLPYSVIRGEIVAIQIVVFNYLDKDLTAEVVLENQGEFEFAELPNAVHDTSKQDHVRRERIEVKANSGTTVSFMIIPKELGHILIKATATSPLAGDSTEQRLLVKAEGETQYCNKAIFIDLKDSKSFETNFVLDIPEDIVLGSELVEISAVGDLLGPSIPNLANLIKMPFGCGEQNMLNFVPNIVLINYLKNMNQLTPAVHEKALKFLEVGYQQELTYRHEDGSFSAFGKSDASGSTWLTAFVAKSFIQASEHITIENRIIKEALQWLAANQSLTGSFPEVGKIYHQDMQGGAAKGLALTAFTLIAFLQHADFANKYISVIKNGVDYIVSNLEGLDDVYSLAICTYVLNLAKHSQEEVAFAMLESKANRIGNSKWWSKPVPTGNKNPWHLLPSSVNVEMTSYAMLTYLRRNMVADSLPIMKWLVSQRNSDGGFASTQDTVIGIHVLSKLGERIGSGDSDIGISFTCDGGNQSNINVNAKNNMILQKHTLPRKTREINVTANGTGFAIIQVSYNYNLNLAGAFPSFTLKPQVDKTSDANNLKLSICAAFIPTKEAEDSNMAVMEVNLPSGFTVDMDSIPSLEETQHVKRVETKNGDTMVALYFDKMVREEYRVTVSAFRTHKVAKQKPVPVSIYDYYDSSRRARVFYEPLATTLNDIC